MSVLSTDLKNVPTTLQPLVIGYFIRLRGTCVCATCGSAIGRGSWIMPVVCQPFCTVVAHDHRGILACCGFKAYPGHYSAIIYRPFVSSWLSFILESNLHLRRFLVVRFTVATVAYALSAWKPLLHGSHFTMYSMPKEA